MSFESLNIERIRRFYTEDMIIYIFWKNFLGKVYRVDFEPIMHDLGHCDVEYQKVIIYKDEKCDWSIEITKSIDEKGNFVLYHTNFDGSNDCWNMYKNLSPIPKANTLKNIHQLQYENITLNAKIAELEDENKQLKAILAELKKV